MYFVALKLIRSSILKQLEITVVGGYSRFQKLQIDTQTTHIFKTL